MCVWTFGDGKNSFLWSWSTQTHKNCVFPGLFSQVLCLLPIQTLFPFSALTLCNVLLCTCIPLTQYFISHSLLPWRLPNYITIHIWCWFINESLKWMGVLAVNTNFRPCLSPLASLQTSDKNLEGHFLFHYQILSFSATFMKTDKENDVHHSLKLVLADNLAWARFNCTFF